MERETYDLFTGFSDIAGRGPIHEDSRTNLVETFNFLVDESRRIIKETQKTDSGEFICYDKMNDAYLIEVSQVALDSYPSFISFVTDFRILHDHIIHWGNVSNYGVCLLINNLINEDNLHDIIRAPKHYILSRIEKHSITNEARLIDFNLFLIIWQALVNIFLKHINRFVAKSSKTHELMITCANKL